jgi:hypothetical protein
MLWIFYSRKKKTRKSQALQNQRKMVKVSESSKYHQLLFEFLGCALFMTTFLFYLFILSFLITGTPGNLMYSISTTFISFSTRKYKHFIILSTNFYSYDLSVINGFMASNFHNWFYYMQYLLEWWEMFTMRFLWTLQNFVAHK